MKEQDSELNEQSIIELQKQIDEYKNKERTYLVQLHIKDKEINYLTSYRNTLKRQIENYKESKSSQFNDYCNPYILNEFKNIKKIIKDKDSLIIGREEELNTLQGANSEENWKKILKKSKEVIKENMDLFNYIKGNNTIENMKQENDLTKSQIEEWMFKLKEGEKVYNDYCKDIDEGNETIGLLKRKTKPGKTELNRVKK